MDDSQPPPRRFFSPRSFFQTLRERFFHRPVKSRKALLRALAEAETANIIDSYSRAIIESVMQVESLKARDVMVPKAKMVTLGNVDSVERILQAVVKSSHSRFPVLSADDKILGIVFAKDLLSHLADAEPRDFNYTDYLRPAIYVPESQSLGALLREFQQQKSHMAIVQDEYGEVAGLVTLEDVIEQIVGEIEDEHDLEEDHIIAFGDARFLLKGETPLAEFNAFFDVDCQAENIDTVAGFVIQRFGHLPEQMTEIDADDFRFKILKADSRKIHLLEVRRIFPEKNGTETQKNHRASD